MRSEKEIRKKLEVHKQLLTEAKGAGSGYQKQSQLRAIEILTWVLK